ncbi:uncharacterized protein BDR25DRAFT_295668 [Lindgomyces ingoldianus]|uniref:Uncharacterized protein n=1 Tax=Lindgomyces ingoldianus TaxID=673940 RepID=A0ACB6QFE0_9PLEO|nr:uncharacterized protein BDR25DRAFT_295668 [Lindgomyces ingoldianus]KAF2465205.1 hypothetical protein BDR25DRAFT_295668 [Lindgomyces ingoldianus]
MPRSHSSYTASPTRSRSPHRSPPRRSPSEDGSQYEMDLDVLGMNSTFDSTGLDASHEPQVDRVESSDIEGPEDFTMNMTYWMTADLPLSQIKSRKEASEDGRPIIDDDSREREYREYDSRSPTMRANGTTDGQQDDKALSEASMENDEKVMSYLSALPDSEVAGAFTSPPPKPNTLQVPKAVSKARSLQATVEDYSDTPRKPTQETVIHHAQERTAEMNSTGSDGLRNRIAELQARLEQQELTSKTRITELETILSYARSELDAAHAENYKQQEQITRLREENDGRRQNQESAIESMGEGLKEQEWDSNARMQNFGEGLRLQNLTKLQNQKEDFEQQLTASEEARRAAERDLEQKEGRLALLQSELEDTRQSKEQELQILKDSQSAEQQKHEQDFAKERSTLNKKLGSLQTLADALQSDLEKATAEAKFARQEAQASAALNTSTATSAQTYTSRIIDLESRLQSLQSQVNSSRVELTTKDQQILRQIEDRECLDQRLHTAQGRIEGLETTISTLRQQLSDAHRESSKSRTDVERFEKDLEDATDRLHDARAEADRRVADVEKRLSKMKELKTESDSRFEDLRSEHEDAIEDHEARLEEIREKAEDAIRKASALLSQERTEKKRFTKELKVANNELEKLRSEASQKATAQERKDEESTVEGSPPFQSDSKDVEIESLRVLLRKQAKDMKALKSLNVSLRRENEMKNNIHTELFSLRKENEFRRTLEIEVVSLRQENSALRSEAQTLREDFEAVNKQLDERIAAVIRRIMKDRTITVVGKRDDQWADSVGKLKDEREFMGRVLMREWGRQECGAVEEGEKQAYRYKYVQRS